MAASETEVDRIQRMFDAPKDWVLANVLEALDSEVDGFHVQVLRLIERATPEQRQQLRLAFPEHVAAFEKEANDPLVDMENHRYRDGHPVVEARMMVFARMDCANICPSCQEKVGSFRDVKSWKEFRISGLCQRCQDKTFGGA